MAGLTRLDGRLKVDGELWQDEASGTFLKPYQRRIGYVFQEASLFPHLSVRNNLLYGAKRASQRQLVVDQLRRHREHARYRTPARPGSRHPFRRRAPARRHRACLVLPASASADGRAAGCDGSATKEEILPYLEALRENLSIPIFYVSHDMSEVERLADTLVLIENGRARAVGPLAELEADPDLPLLRAPEAAVTLEARISSVDEHMH